MNILDLQTRLKQSGRDPGALDGKYGNRTAAAVLLALTDGPDTRLTELDFEESAARLGVSKAHIKAVAVVESSGAGFSSGRPVLLFEPHRFSKATKRKFDKSHPSISYSTWDRTKYPRTQQARYDQLLTAVALDVNAGFASASYGRFQILGENFAACGFSSSFDFAIAQAYDEETQLKSFESFITNLGLLKFLRAKDWDSFARLYNGTAYRQNQYPEKLQKGFVESGGI